MAKLVAFAFFLSFIVCLCVGVLVRVALVNNIKSKLIISPFFEVCTFIKLYN